MRGVDQDTVQETRTVPDGARPKRGLRSILHRPRRRPFHYTLTGLAGAVVFLCLSLTPSLLPRTGVTQGLISGITAAFGYGVGVLAANVWDAFAGREAQPARRRPWLIFLGVAVVAYIAATVFGRYWQARIRALMDAPPDSALSLVVVPVVAAVVFVLLIALCRALHRVYRWIAEPEYRDGRTVRFTDDPGADVPPSAEPWDGSRVLYLLHPSDPIVWWGPQLMYARPDWLEEPRGDDVVDAVRWIPFVTFWQVTADLPFATNVPDGHGHVYTTEYVDAWAHVLQPPGWTDEKAERLRDLLADGG
jgi:uncharacterized membrane protein